MQNRPEVKVDSSNIDTLSLTDRILRVKFKSGSAYIYQNVSPNFLTRLWQVRQSVAPSIS